MSLSLETFTLRFNLIYIAPTGAIHLRFTNVNTNGVCHEVILYNLVLCFLDFPCECRLTVAQGLRYRSAFEGSVHNRGT